MRRAALVAGLALAGSALVPAGAQAHSLVRARGDVITYVAADATSLNALTGRVAGGRLVLRDTAVDGGIDPGPCRPVDVAPGSGWIIEVSCPRHGTAAVRADLGEREDSAVVRLPVPVVLRGGAGVDDLAAGARADALFGGDGRDRLAGAGGDDRLDGGSGDDALAGGDGADALDGGLGRDLLEGGAGDDVLRGRDGQADDLRCGAGADRVEADTLDVAAADCEQVERAPIAPPPEPGPAGADEQSPRVRAGGPVRQPLSRIRILATSSERGALSTSGFLDVGGLSLPVHGDRRPVAIGGGGVVLHVKLAARERRRVRRAMRRGRRATVRMGVVGTDRAGNSRLVVAAPIRLRLPRARAAGSGSADGDRTRRPRARASHPEPGDLDGDGVGDSADNCPAFRNADQADLDRDGAGDACEADPDADGVEADGRTDNCRLVANPDQADGDGDGFGDACDGDTDGDGAPNPADGCPAIADDQRADLDADRQGDACDPDDDDDGVFDDRDRCARVPDPLQADADRDGVGGACDADEPPLRRWRPADGPWPADREAPRVGVHVEGGLAVRVRCSERCFVAATLRSRRATVAEGTAALAGPGVTYVFLRRPRSLRGRPTVRVEVSDPFGNVAH